MTIAQLEKRLAALEKAVTDLQNGRTSKLPEPGQQKPWWHTEAGRFANDPVFDEIVRLGREYRESLRPGYKKKGKKKSKKAHARS